MIRRTSPFRRVVYLRRWSALALVCLVVLSLGVYLPLVLLAPLSSVSAAVLPYKYQPSDAAALVWPGYGGSAIAAVGYPEALQSNGSTAALPMASISKIITSLVVLQAKPLVVGDPGPTITFTAADAALTKKYIALNGDTKQIVAGSTISESDLLKVALVASANNYATALAVWAYGTESKFVAAARSWLGVHGLGQTVLVEPTGIDAHNVSTASNLVTLGQLALADPVIAGIVSTQSLTLPLIGTFSNTNTLLGENGVTGIKTGTLNGISNLLFSATWTIGTHRVTVVGAVLGGTSHLSVDRVVSALLSSVRAGFHEVALSKSGQEFAHYRTAWNATARAVASSSNSMVVWGATPVTARVTAFRATVPSADNTSADFTSAEATKRPTPAGTVTFAAGDQRVDVALVFDRRLSEPTAFWRISNPFAASF